jgi:cytochrome c peroxidase
MPGTLRTVAMSLTIVAALVAASCSRATDKPAPISATPVGSMVAIKAPLGLPPLPVPAENPPTLETIELGRKLFYETRLSRDNTVSCATCHNPGLGFTDGRKLSAGVSGRLGTRNAPTVLNSAYLPIQFWDGRAASLEEQAIGPMGNSVEMDQPHELYLPKLNADPTYRARFEKCFGPGGITTPRIERALASFERTLLSGNSPFDRYKYGGERNALTPSAIHGLAVFTDPAKGNCSVCHTIGEKYALFTDGKFHNLGVGMNSEGVLTDLGRYEQTKREADKGAFRTPTLRNIARTGPYMHDGSEKTLQQVVDFYIGGGNSNPQLDKEIKPLTLTKQDQADLIAFLQSLTGEAPEKVGPPQD